MRRRRESLSSSAIHLIGAVVCTLANAPTYAAGASACTNNLLGKGVVAQVDGMTLRMSDGREVRLSGIEPAPEPASSTDRAHDLTAGQTVTWHGDDDTPDRYGRQHGFVILEHNGALVQAALLRAGAAVASGTVLNTPCSSELTAAEAAAREARQGLWADPHAVRNARNSDDVRAASGRFALVEGTVLSARQAGATFYLNFGRRWTRDFAVTVPRHVKGLFDQGGVDLKALAGRRVRIRGWIEPHPVPRIELRAPGQVEILDHR